MNKHIYRLISLKLSFSALLLFSAQATALENFYTDDNTLKRTLGNGMAVVVHESHKVELATVHMIVKTGSATEGRFSGSGISHLLEHMLFKGERGESQGSYHERIKSLGGYMNGFTAHDYTGYTVTVSSRSLTEALRIMKEMIAYPAFDALELEKEKEVIIDEIRRSKDNTARVASDISWGMVFQRHPYKYPIIGHEDLFAQIKKGDLEEYYSTRYSPHNMILVITGDVKRDGLFDEVDHIFGPLKRNFVASAANIDEPTQLSRQSRTEYRDISLAHVMLSHKSVSINDAALYPLDILAIVLGRGEDSILTKELREKRRLLHSVICRNGTLRDSGIFYVYFTADPAKADDAVAAVLKEFEKIKNDGISEDDLKKAKRIAKAAFVNELETAAGRARDISISEVLANDYNLSDIYLNNLMDVTADEVKTAARKYLRPEFLNEVRIMPEGERDAAEETVTTKRFSRKVLREAMPDGMRILVCEDHSTPICSISALFLGGVRAENSSNNGISYLTAKLLVDGTKNRSEEEIKRAVEEVGGSMQNISGNNSFGITLDFLSSDWKIGIEIVSDIILNPLFDDKKVEKEKALAFAAIKARDDSITNTGILMFRRAFFEGHPYRLDSLGTKESIQGIKREEIVSYYESLCVPGNTVIAVCGDIDAEEVIAEIKKQFAAFEEREPRLPDPPDPKIPETKKEILYAMEREQSLVLMGFPAVKLTDNDRYAFEVINSIMSGGSGRMFVRIRNKLGMGYSLGSSFMPGLEPGCQIFYALTAQKNIGTVKDAILKEVKELKIKAVPEKELEAAKKYLVTSFTSGLERNKAFGMKIALDELYGLGYDSYEEYNNRINGVTAGQIKRVANQYFNMKNCLIVLIQGGHEEPKEGKLE